MNTAILFHSVFEEQEGAERMNLLVFPPKSRINDHADFPLAGSFPELPVAGARGVREFRHAVEDSEQSRH